MRFVSRDPAVQPNPEVFACGCVVTCYEDDEDADVRDMVLSPCRSDPPCQILTWTVEIAAEAGKPVAYVPD